MPGRASVLDKELLISRLARLPVQVDLVKSCVHEAHFHFLLAAALDLFAVLCSPF